MTEMSPVTEASATEASAPKKMVLPDAQTVTEVKKNNDYSITCKLDQGSADPLHARQEGRFILLAHGRLDGSQVNAAGVAALQIPHVLCDLVDDSVLYRGEAGHVDEHR